MDVLTYYCVNIRGTVLDVVGLNDGFQDPVGMNITLTLMVSDEQAFENLDLQMGQRYLVYGMDYVDKDWLAQQGDVFAEYKNTVTLTVRNLQQLQGLPEEYAVPTIAPLTGTSEEFLNSEQGKLWQQALENIAVNNQSFPILGVDDLSYVAEFALGTTRIVQGRDFTAEEQNKGANVCVLSESLATANGIDVGDTITLQYYDLDENSPYQSMLSSGRGVVNPSARFYTATTPLANEGQSYTVVGLYRSQNEWADPATNVYAFTPNTVFVPKASVGVTMDYSNQGLFRSYVLYNGQLETFQQLAAEAGYSDLFRCDDHGYAAVASALHDYTEVAQRTLTIGLSLSTLIAVLFFLLFPLQQQKNLNTMASMGATVGERMVYILKYSLWLVLPGSALGALFGTLLWMQKMKIFTAQYGADFSISLNMAVLGICTLAMLLFMVLMSILLAFLRMCRQNLMNRK